MARLTMLAPRVSNAKPIVDDWIKRTQWGDLVRPELLPKPACKVWLVCGPPAAGKSTYVREHAGHDDIVIDVDTIAREYGMGRERPSEITAMLLMERNDRLAALAGEPLHRVAWFITGGATQELRQWWCRMLGVMPEHLIVLTPSKEDLHHRIMNDEDRRRVRRDHLSLVDHWFERDGG